MIIYKATNLINGKCYVGKTIEKLNTRISKHFSSVKKLENVNDDNNYFHNAIKLYGKDNFTWEVLKECNDYLMLNLMETFMIIVHKTHYTEGGYNLTWGGDGSFGFKHTEKTKLKMSIARLGKKQTEEQKNNTSKALIGHIVSEETKEKLRKPKSEEGRKNITISAQRFAKIWKIINPDGKVIIIKNLRIFCRNNELNYKNMFAVAAGKRPTCKGYKCERQSGRTPGRRN